MIIVVSWLGPKVFKYDANIGLYECVPMLLIKPVPEGRPPSPTTPSSALGGSLGGQQTSVRDTVDLALNRRKVADVLVLEGTY